MSDDEDETHCPLCVEEMDLSDKNFLPCPCGYRVCMWCWHHIRENLNGLCPACRTPYAEDPHAFSAVDRQEIIKKNKERRQKEKQERHKDAVNRPSAGTTGTNPTAASTKTSTGTAIDRKHLHNYRVVQRNLVYVIGLPTSVAVSEDQLKKSDYFGQYGKISKVVIHRNHAASHSTVSGYITFAHKDDARACIQALDGFWVDGHMLRASFGTTKYCNNFIRGIPCNNPECVYLHDLGEDEDRFTKEEIQHAGHTKLNITPGKDQILVTGNGGPSGTGKRPQGEPVLPPPVFIQDNITTQQAPARPAPAPRVNSGTWSGANPIVSGSNDTVEVKKDAEKGSNDEPDSAPQTFFGALSGTNSNSSRGTEKSRKSNSSAATEGGSTNGNDSSETTPRQNSEDNATSSNNNDESIAVRGQKQKHDVMRETKSQSSKTDESQSSKESEEKARVLDSADSVSDIRFNGFSSCAVFPVPMSSLKISVWSGILDSSSNQLESNPFKSLVLPYSELLELTMPPVDAVGLTTWPKPHAYYAQRRNNSVGGMSEDQIEQPRPMSIIEWKSALPYGATRGSTVPAPSADSVAAIQGTAQPAGFNALRQLFPGVNMSMGTTAAAGGGGSKLPES